MCKKKWVASVYLATVNFQSKDFRLYSRWGWGHVVSEWEVSVEKMCLFLVWKKKS